MALLTIYDASVTVFLHNLNQLVHLLRKGEAWAAEQGSDPANLIQARLAPDMRPLAFQVQAASDAAKLAAGRLTGLAVPRFEDNERSFAELQARIANTRAFLAGLPREAFEGGEDRAFTLKAGDTELHFTGQPYLLHYALPNFFFHVTTAYDILRHQGVPVGKRDYLGRA